MVPALWLMMVLAAGEGTPSGSPSGVSATDFLPAFLPERPRVDRSLLGDAPTSELTAFTASLTTVSVGLVTSGAFMWALATGPSEPSWAGWVGLASGLLVANFGANMGDLMNGDLQRFVIRGLARLTILAISTLVFPATFYWLGLLAADVALSTDAPARWVQRSAVAPAHRVESPPASPTEEVLAGTF